MIIDELLKVLPPPHQPVGTRGDAKAWNLVFRDIGIRLPEDYVQFINRYGYGAIDGWMYIYHPFIDHEHMNLVKAVPQSLSMLRQSRQEHPDLIPYPLYFEPGGLLPWGHSMDGDYYCWITKGLQVEWKTAVICRHADPEVFDLSMTQYIAAALKGEIRSMAIPSPFEPVFVIV